MVHKYFGYTYYNIFKKMYPMVRLGEKIRRLKKE